MDFPDLLARSGLPLVFAAVLVEQAGLPLPAVPVLVTAGALAWDGVFRPEAVLACALGAALLADHAWFLAGRLRGRAVLAGICRLSLSPDTCVRRTDGMIGRYGAQVLMVAKFIPGVSAVAIPTAAAMGIAYRRFILFDFVGALAWCGLYIAAGMIFSREVNDVLDVMARVGGWSLAAVAALFAAYIGLKLRQRRRLRHLYHLVRIEPDEVAAMLANGEPVVILDARTSLARAEDPRTLPDAIRFDLGHGIDALPGDAREKTIVTFCTCPNEASAALLAERLLRAGYERVRVLTGGTAALEVLGR